MSLLDKLGIDKSKQKKDPTKSMSFIQKQSFLRSERKKMNDKTKEMLSKKKVVPPVMRECPICGDPMKVAVGQLMFCHKECKAKYKRHMRKATK